MRNIDLSLFGLGFDLPHIGPSSRSFRPPSWPPPKDWVWVEDKDGNPVSRFGDPIIDFTPWFGTTTKFAFGDGPKLRAYSPVIDPANADILRTLLAYRGWGPGAPQNPLTVVAFAKRIRMIVAVCCKHRILATDLSRYPDVIDLVAQALAPSEFDRTIAELDRLRDARDILGFELLDRAGIERLKSLQPGHDSEQTEYMPPRIWTYVVSRVAECVRDYTEHRDAIEACFAYCEDAYECNEARAYYERTGKCHRNPFQIATGGRTGERSGITYHGPFADTAQRFGIKALLEKWVGKAEVSGGIRAFAHYFQVVQFAALVDIAAFTLMRIEEATSVRWRCLQWHEDPVFGRIPLIQARTTKTDPDDGGLWVTTPGIEQSINALQSITEMRLTSVGQWGEDGGNPRLITGAIEPWACGKNSRDSGTQPPIKSLGQIVKSGFLLFDSRQLTLTEEDLRIARAVCPTLNQDKFQLGKPWALGWHQFRRTGAVNMFASGDISDSSIQLQMKHLTRLQSLYYGRGNTTLHLSDSVRVLLVNAFYEGMGRDIKAMQTDRFVSPYGDEYKARLFAPTNDDKPVSLISEDDAHHYEKVFRQHRIGGRLTVLGGCMKNGTCDGDCVTSVGDCAGGDGKAPCVNVLFDRTRAPANQKRLDGVRLQLDQTPPDTPKHRQLMQEQRGLENYFVYISKAA